MYTDTGRDPSFEKLNALNQASKSMREMRDYGEAPSAPEGLAYGTKGLSLRGRIQEARRSGQAAIERYQAAERAQQIIDKNPEFAELLDLIQRF